MPYAAGPACRLREEPPPTTRRGGRYGRGSMSCPAPGRLGSTVRRDHLPFAEGRPSREDRALDLRFSYEFCGVTAQNLRRFCEPLAERGAERTHPQTPGTTRPALKVGSLRHPRGKLPTPLRPFRRNRTAEPTLRRDAAVAGPEARHGPRARREGPVNGAGRSSTTRMFGFVSSGPAAVLRGPVAGAAHIRSCPGGGPPGPHRGDRAERCAKTCSSLRRRVAASRGLAPRSASAGGHRPAHRPSGPADGCRTALRSPRRSRPWFTVVRGVHGRPGPTDAAGGTRASCTVVRGPLTPLP
jgi:hypothetical protein